jgi:serine/threonine protein kinase
MAKYLGHQFGNYRLIKLLGEGGFAEVYLGVHIHLGTYAAVKILTTNLTNDEIAQFRTFFGRVSLKLPLLSAMTCW